MTGSDDLLTAGGLRVAWSGPGGEPVVTITLARPERRNAQTPSTWLALAEVARSLPEGTRAVVIRADGPHFSAGIDLRMFGEGVPGEDDLPALASMTDAGLDSTLASYQDGFAPWSEGDVPSVALVQGAAVGAGFQLALACDILVAAQDARFCMRETSLGLVPDLGGTGALVRAVGHRRAVELCLTGRWVDAQEALRLGLAAAVVPVDSLAEAGAATVAALLAAPATSVAATRRLLRAAPTSEPSPQRGAERAEQAALLRGLSAGGR